MDDSKANQMIKDVEEYYHAHKRDVFKPKIWDLIVLVKYLAHRIRAKENIISKLHEYMCGVDLCKHPAAVLTPHGLMCSVHAKEFGYCIRCGKKAIEGDSYCTICEQVEYEDGDY